MGVQRPPPGTVATGLGTRSWLYSLHRHFRRPTIERLPITAPKRFRACGAFSSLLRPIHSVPGSYPRPNKENIVR